MTNLLNFVCFQAFWFAAVGGAASGRGWVGPLALAVLLAVHLRLVPRGERRAELTYVLLVGLAGLVLDTGLALAGATAYPGSARFGPLVPAWIVTLWVAFATLPRYSLGWLRGRPVLAALLGALGGPLSYLAGVRMGAVAAGEGPAPTWLALAVEYALVTPLLLHLAPRRGPGG